MNFLLPRVGTAAAAAAAGETFAPIQLESKWLGSAFSLEFDGGPAAPSHGGILQPPPREDIRSTLVSRRTQIVNTRLKQKGAVKMKM